MFLAGLPEYPEIVSISSSNPEVLKAQSNSMGLYKKVPDLWVNNRPVWTQIIGGSYHLYSTGKIDCSEFSWTFQCKGFSWMVSDRIRSFSGTIESAEIGFISFEDNTWQYVR